ncbi:response regulator transcription factor [Hutsoniella sourekii]|uniref:response regulator transcription factor n=1 Tax=Hutsoniella sourekii TaxID=87650 RepID=UPI0004803F27|nr:response regulator transcription factor [Hutsoniella sourekii]
MAKILLIEDDQDLAELYQSVLRHANYSVDWAYHGHHALDFLESNKYDLIITDLMMPEGDGYGLIDDIRGMGLDLPILIITAKAGLEDKRQGFLKGADDYMVKPIDVDEMVLRVEALLRRYKIVNQASLQIGDFRLDEAQLKIFYQDQTIELALKEFQLLFKLLSYPNQIFTRRQLMDDIWGLDSDSDERTVDVHIKRIRDHLKELPNFTDFQIITVRGLGYKAEVQHV